MLGLVFAYYIYKKKFASKFYKIMLFLPSIISSIVLITIFKYFANFILPQLFEKWFDAEIPALTSDVSTTLGTIIFYNIFAGFGTSILLYSGAMTNVSESVLEAAKIDGVGPVREFVQIIVPLIYPTLKTLLITGVATIFTADMGLFSFYGTGAKPYLYTFGYYILRGARTATLAEYPYLASVGVSLTFVAVPLTFFVRWLLTKFGPSVE
jgi:ABC-type sugar transport system permease subunit